MECRACDSHPTQSARNLVSHPLDRCVWSSLTTRHAAEAIGNPRALRYHPDYGPFAAAADSSAENLAALSALVRSRGPISTVEAEETETPPGTQVVKRAPCFQMIGEKIDLADGDLIPLNLCDTDAKDMLALATLTNPGPFAARTNRLGEFIGLRRAGHLVAMAGERMKPDAYTEISGVCSHPDYRGRGYAGELTRLAAKRIIMRGEIPFLHVFAANTSAIKLYEKLGFVLRRESNTDYLSALVVLLRRALPRRKRLCHGEHVRMKNPRSEQASGGDRAPHNPSEPLSGYWPPVQDRDKPCC